MASDPLVWLLRIVWLALPFTLGDAIGRALDGRSTPVVVVGSALAWALWAIALVASFVTLPVGLTALRWVVPAAPVSASVLGFIGSPADGDAALNSVPAVIGIALALVAAACALSTRVADEYVNGASYGDERRFALRVPLGLVLGPIPLLWIASVAGVCGGLLLLAARNWVFGTILLLVGAGATAVASRSFHLLSRRWLVFVPAGVTLVDPLALVDPILFPRKRISRFGPAFEGTTAVDLSGAAPGLVLEFSFDMQLDISRRVGRGDGELTMVQAVLVTPGRPGSVMSEATRRGIPTPHSKSISEPTGT